MKRFISHALAFFCVALAALALITLIERNYFLFSFEMKATNGGLIQLFYDRGAGIRETDSILIPIVPGERFVHYELPLNIVKYRALRFDPTNRPGNISICNVKIKFPFGGAHSTIPVERITAVHQIENLTRREKCLSFSVPEGSFDPMLDVPFPSRLLLADRSPGTKDLLPQIGLLAFLALGFAAIVVTLARVFPARKNLTFLRYPKCSIAFAALLGVLLSHYPVILLRKSFVSPSVQPAQLYFQYPSLPGYHDSFVEDSRGLDVGATAWAFLPYSRIQYHALFEHGELPLWNRYNSGGVTLIGQGQSQIGDPLHWLTVVTNGSAWAWDLRFVSARFLVGLGAGLAVLLTSSSIGAAAAVAFSAQFLGLYVFRLNHIAGFSATYAPWIVLCWLYVSRSIREKTRMAIPAAGIVLFSLFQFCAGGLKESVLSLIFAHVCGGLCVAFEKAAVVEKFKALLRLFPFGIAGALIVSPFALTFLDGLSGASTLSDSEFINTADLGSLGAYVDTIFSEQFAGKIGFPALNLFLGLGIALAVGAMPQFRNIPAYWAALLSFLLCLLVAFGAFSPALLMRLPFLGRVNHLVDCVVTASIAPALLLAGFGIAQLLRWASGIYQRWTFVLIGEILLASVIFYTYYVYPHGVDQPAAYALSLFLVLSALLIAPLLALAKSVKWLQTFSLSVATLLVLGIHLKNGIHPPTGLRNIDRLINNLGDRPDYSNKSDAISYLSELQTKSRSIGETATLFPGFNAFYLIESINGPDALMNPYWNSLLDALELRPWESWIWLRLVTAADLQRLSRALDFLNVGNVLAERALQQSSDFTLATAKDIQVYQRSNVWPRAFFTDQLNAYATVQDLHRMVLESDGRPFAAIEQPAAAFAIAAPSRVVLTPTRVSFTTNTTTLSIDAPSAGVVTLLESFVPYDCYVRVNGAAQQLLRVNHAFRAVRIPAAGHYEITFGYWPANLSSLLWLACGGWLLLAGLVFYPKCMPHRARVSARTPCSIPVGGGGPLQSHATQADNHS